jgi:site-specific DNA recombinase
VSRGDNLNAIYCRVSTEDQAKKGYSLDDQITACKAFLLREGKRDIVEYVDRGYSGEFIDRPALTNLRDDIAAGRIASVVVYDPDRLARKLSIQLLVAEEIEKSNASLHFITGDYAASPDGRLFFSLRGAIAEFEKAKIADRTLRGKRKKASQGKIIMDFGLFGYDYNKENCNYTINDDQAEIIRKIYAMVLKHHISIKGVQKMLKQNIIFSPTGKPLWPLSSLYNILTNKTYLGTFISMKYRYQKIGIKRKIVTERPKDEWITISVPPIIDKITFEQVQQQLQANKATPRQPIVHPFLLSGIIFCGICGRRMLAHSCMFRDGTTKAYYQCAAHRYAALPNADSKCKSRGLPAAALDGDVWNELLKALYNPVALVKHVPRQSELADNSNELLRLTTLMDDLVKRRDAIVKWFRQQMISMEESEAELTQISQQLMDIQKRQKVLQPAATKNSPTSSSFENTFEQLRPLIESGEALTTEEKKFIIHALLTKITVIRIDNHRGKGARSKAPEFKIAWDMI